MPNELFLGRGGGGLRQGGQLEEDIRQMSDPAVRARRLEETQGPAQEAVTGQNLQNLQDPDFEGQMQSLHKMLGIQVEKQAIRKGMKDLDPVEDHDEYVKAVDTKIKEMYKAAQDVKSSGTGNTGAYNTYMRVAEILIDRLTALQDEGIQNLAKPTTQPSGGE